MRWAAALTACGFTLGLVYAFTTVATQTVVRPERAGEAAGITLTLLITVAGVGVSVASTVLETLQRNAIPLGTAVGNAQSVVARKTSCKGVSIPGQS